MISTPSVVSLCAAHADEYAEMLKNDLPTGQELYARKVAESIPARARK